MNQMTKIRAKISERHKAEQEWLSEADTYEKAGYGIGYLENLVGDFRERPIEVWRWGDAPEKYRDLS